MWSILVSKGVPVGYAKDGNEMTVVLYFAYTEYRIDRNNMGDMFCKVY